MYFWFLVWTTSSTVAIIYQPSSTITDIYDISRLPGTSMRPAGFAPRFHGYRTILDITLGTYKLPERGISPAGLTQDQKRACTRRLQHAQISLLRINTATTTGSGTPCSAMSIPYAGVPVLPTFAMEMDLDLHFTNTSYVVPICCHPLSPLTVLQTRSTNEDKKHEVSNLTSTQPPLDRNRNLFRKSRDTRGSEPQPRRATITRL